ncbi:MAG: Ppx/GppA phosphatase family protein [Corynebacterium sp.]|nr:Ppx/GppA phosphatase family protein [Corynebacterium sp.]
MTRVAAVDCGTNSIRLLISEARSPKEIKDVTRTMEIVRLGQGVDATGEFAPEALQRVEKALRSFVDQMKFEHVERVRMVATSASRDAKNSDEFFSMTARLLGEVQPGACAEVISGEEEAQLSFRGAVSDLSADKGPFCVIDLGGGSTEFIVGTAAGSILGAHSAQMGCVRITERILHSDPPLEGELRDAEEFVAKQLEQVEAKVPVAEASTFVGCAGTFTTLSALAQGLEKYDPRYIHGSTLRFDALRVLTAQIKRETFETRAQNPVIHPGRADVLAGGAVSVEGIMDLISRNSAQRSFYISEKDILDGTVAGIVDELYA